MLAAVLSYNLESIAADQSEDNHRESIIIQVSNSDLHSLTTDFVRHSGVQNLSLRPFTKVNFQLRQITNKMNGRTAAKVTIFSSTGKPKQRRSDRCTLK